MIQGLTAGFVYCCEIDPNLPRFVTVCGISTSQDSLSLCYGLSIQINRSPSYEKLSNVVTSHPFGGQYSGAARH